ncbi:MAG: T9SS C-terminal target domain-containing protein [Porphyromonadaceae bacterium]|nr:MAG: T9SS C-terminal target domain-containing protein [Porphyromonadaceae bacterium]
MRFRFLFIGCLLLNVLYAGAQYQSTYSNGLEGKVVRAIYIDGHDTKWFGTDEGLTRLDGINWKNYGSGNFLFSLFINDIWVDETNGNMIFWVATRGGLSVAVYSQGEFLISASYSQLDGLLGDDILSLCRDNQGIQYAASISGINYLSSNSWKSLTYSTYPDNIPNAPVRVIHSRNDSLYAGTSGGIGRFVNTVDGMTGATRWTSEYGISPLSDDITAIFVDSKGNQWFGTSVGLQKHEGILAKEGWSQFIVADGLVNNYILAISEAPSGEIWVGTKGGVSIFSGRQWQSLQQKDGLVCDTVYDIAFETDGSAWLATHQGVSHYKSGSFLNHIAILEKVKRNLDMQINYPRGADQVDFVFYITQSQTVNITIYDISGKVISKVGGNLLPAGRNVLSCQLYQQSLKTQPGLYIYRFQSSDLNKSDKFFLIR